jgi:hypothetical protein
MKTRKQDVFLVRFPYPQRRKDLILVRQVREVVRKASLERTKVIVSRDLSDTNDFVVELEYSAPVTELATESWTTGAMRCQLSRQPWGKAKVRRLVNECS